MARLSALERYSLERPDVVLLDLVMKGMYGLEVLNRLRELDPTACVIVVSADVQTSSREMVQAAGAAGFLSKPLEPGPFLGLVDDVVKGRLGWN